MLSILGQRLDFHQCILITALKPQRVSSVPPPIPLRSSSITDGFFYVMLSVGSENLNSGPHACLANIYPETPPWPSMIIVYWSSFHFRDRKTVISMSQIKVLISGIWDDRCLSSASALAGSLRIICQGPRNWSSVTRACCRCLWECLPKKNQ